MNKFEVGKTYFSESYVDSNQVETFVCVKRTKKTATFKSDYETITKAIKNIKGKEAVKFDDGFSFIYSDKEVA